MSKFNQKGNIFLFLVILFAVVTLIAGLVIYKTFTNSTKKLAQSTEAIDVALKTEYQNPFDKKTQYTNPFNDYQNPFDQIK